MFLACDRDSLRAVPQRFVEVLELNSFAAHGRSLDRALEHCIGEQAGATCGHVLQNAPIHCAPSWRSGNATHAWSGQVRLMHGGVVLFGLAGAHAFNVVAA